MGSENIKFFYENEWDSQTLAATTEDTSFPTENTQSRSKTKQFRTTDLLAETLRTDGSSDLDMAAFCLFGCNFSSAATVKVQGSDDNWVSTPYDETMIQGTGRYTGQWVHFPDTIVNYDDWGVYVNDPGCADAYLAIGRVWMPSSYWEPERGYNVGSQYRLIDPAIVNISDGEQVSVVKRTKYFMFDLGFNWISDRPGFEDMFFEVGHTDQLMILKKPDNFYIYAAPENNTYLVRMLDNNLGGIFRDKWTLSLSLKEDL